MIKQEITIQKQLHISGTKDGTLVYILASDNTIYKFNIYFECLIDISSINTAGCSILPTEDPEDYILYSPGTSYVEEGLNPIYNVSICSPEELLEVLL